VLSLLVALSQPAKHRQKRSSTSVSTLFWRVLLGFELQQATAATPTARPQTSNKYFQKLVFPL